jgi:hypothetical protein
MLKRWPYYFIFFLAVCCIVSVPALPQVKGAVVQQWNYDPTHNPPLVTVKIVNNSHKDITAFNIAIKETYADGCVEQHEMLEDRVGYILAAKELQGDTSRGKRKTSVSSTGMARFMRAQFGMKNYLSSPD